MGFGNFFTGKIALSWGRLHFFKFLITWLLSPRNFQAKPPRRKKDGQAPIPSAPPLPEIRSALFEFQQNDFFGRKKK